jgi:hypothetical protein
LNLGNACYQSVQNLLFSHLLSKIGRAHVWTPVTS